MFETLPIKIIVEKFFSEFNISDKEKKIIQPITNKILVQLPFIC